MTKYLLFLPLLWPCWVPAADMMIYTHGMASPGIYVPGFRTYSTGIYSSAEPNIELLKKLAPKIPKLRIAGFGANEPGKASLVCRLSFPVFLPGKIPLEAYLAEAMRTELLEAGIYADTSPVALNAHLLAMDFNSIGTGKWTIEAIFSVEGKGPVTIKFDYSYPIGLGAVQACADVSRALVPAIQGFLHATYSDPGFQALLLPTVSPDGQK